MDQDKVWVGDPKAGFILGRIVEFADDGPVVQPLDRALKPVITTYDRMYPAEEEDKKEVDDNCSLMYLNEATLLNNVKLRYAKDKIYTYVANILVAVNPYFDIKELYSPGTIKSYHGKSLGTMPPHVFAIADKAFRDMKVLKQSQSVIVSGESGAGKTESTKHILNYLCSNFGQTAGSLEKKILNANPILEAFGNAKTTRNNNSSRFGKFIEIHFDGRCQVAGGHISHYLLERARVVSQNDQERNYHIFYQLCAGATDDMRRKLKLGAPDNFRYLASGCSQYFLSKQNEKSLSKDRLSAEHRKKGCLSDAMLDDVNDFKCVDRDLANIGMSDSERMSVYTTIATVLHIGNISFEDDPDDNRGGCRVTDQSEQSLMITSSLMGLDADELRRALTARVMQATKGGYKGTVIMVPLKVHEASNARDALAKALYSHLFDYIVMRINKSIPFQSSNYYIGVLDIAGFEYFTVNSFEQFCINYCNEKLQQFFNQRILKDEQELYKKEGLGVKNVNFVDNQDCIHLIETKGSGIFSLLDEESKLPKPNWQHFTSAVHNNNGSHFRLALPRKSKLKEHREIRDEDGFLIRHFAGAVCYTTKHFIEKNNDALHASLEMVAQECKNKFMEVLFKAGESSAQNKGKLTFISVGGKFKTQLGELMEKLRSTGTNFIRCIKPNVRMVAHMFDGSSVLSQLQCAGMTSVLELMQQGFPSRAPFSDIYNMYKKFLPPDLARLDPRLFCKALFKALGLDDNDFKFGMTKVFFRPGKFAEFDTLMRSDPENLKVLISRVKKWLLRSQWKKAQWCALSVIKLKNKILHRRQALITIQKTVRMHLAKKRHRPRYQALVKIRNLSGQVKQIGSMTKSLKSDKDGVEKSVRKIQDNIDQVCKTIKGNETISKKEIEKYYKSLVDQINKELSNVKSKIEKQKAADEQVKLRKLQQEMEEERRKKEAEDAEIRRIEEERKMKAEMEVKRKQEEDKRKKQEEKDKATLASMQQDLDNANAKLAEQHEQERRDHEIALRLAEESGGGVDELTPSLKRSSLVNAQREANAGKKYDLAKWKYAELRDTINTSCDIDLLEACREEFHRRLKVYHAWKARNKKKNTTFNDDMRAPSSITDEAKKNVITPAKKSVTSTDQRFFRIPFVRPDENQEGAKGWWYAHFDGEWIGRQMELHPGREPVMLLAGKDDMQMCELSLDETGLTRKRGAEILNNEFEKEWLKNGGALYNRPADRKTNGN